MTEAEDFLRRKLKTAETELVSLQKQLKEKRREVDSWRGWSPMDKTLRVMMVQGKPSSVNPGMYLGSFFFGPYPIFGIFRIDGSGDDAATVTLSGVNARVMYKDFRCLAFGKIEIITGDAPEKKRGR